MTAGIGILAGCLLVVGAIVAVQLFAGRYARRLEGEPVPSLPGPLGERLRGDVVLWFHSATCGPCKAMEPGIRALEAQGLAIVIDAHTQVDVARAFGVMATPTTVVVQGGRIQRVRMGVLGPAELASLAS